MSEQKKIVISIVIPCHNEEGAVTSFYNELVETLKEESYEAIFVDDGSTDKTFEILSSLNKTDSRVRVIKLRKKSGISAGFMAGLHLASGELIVTIDGDMQQRPRDIPQLLKKIREGFDVVSGEKKNRKGQIYRIIARVGYFLRKRLLGIPIRDTAYTPNVYRKQCLANVHLYGDMQRFLVPMLYLDGYKVAEIPISHYPRMTGTSKFSPLKAFRGFFDLMVVKFWYEYSTRPMHFFGAIGLTFVTSGFVIGMVMIIRKLFFHISIYRSVLPMFAVGLVVIGIQFFVLGILADFISRVYFRDHAPYDIENRI